jgi:hypothetical protein
MRNFALGMICGPWLVPVTLAALLLTGAIRFGGYDSTGQVILLFGSAVFAGACTIAGALLWAVWRVVGVFKQ